MVEKAVDATIDSDIKDQKHRRESEGLCESGVTRLVNLSPRFIKLRPKKRQKRSHEEPYSQFAIFSTAP